MEEILEYSTISSFFFLPYPVRHFLQCWRDYCQDLYNKATLSLLNIFPFSILLRFFHLFLFYFRIYTEMMGHFIDKYISLNMFALIVSLIMSRLHIAGYLISFCLLIIHLDFWVLSMARFYKKYPEKLVSLNIKRHMWSQATKIVQEASTNPQVQAVGVAVAGALAWKVLDVYDTQTSKEIADADRSASKEIADADREAENARHAADREAENARHAAELRLREAELEQSRLAHMEEMAMRERELHANKT